MILVSIIVPVYNVEKYLERCIDSLVNQTLKDIEIILVDDGSTDSSGRICDEYAKKDKRIKVIHKENGGVSSARNKGIEKSKGKYIMFCDSDDWIEHNMLEILYDNIEKKKTDIIFSGFYGDLYIDNNLYKSVSEGISFDINSNIVGFNKLFIYIFNTSRTALQSPWAKLFKTEIIKKNNILFKTNMICYEDFEFNLRYLTYCNSFTYLKDIMYHYVNNYGESSLSRRNKNNLVYEISCTYEAFMNFLIYINAEQDLKNYVYEYFCEAFLLPIRKIADSKNKLKYNIQKEVLNDLINDKSFLDLYNNINKRFYNIVVKLVNYKFYRLCIIFIRKRLKI